MPGYTNANEPMNQKNRVPCHPFCEMRIFVSPHYDQGLVGFAPELCKMVRQLSFHDLKKDGIGNKRVRDGPKAFRTPEYLETAKVRPNNIT